MQELFLYGTFWFWVLTAAAVIITFLFSENENGLGATICLALYVGLLQWCSDVDPLTYAWQHPVLALAWLGGYFVLGTIWASVKWVLFVQDGFTEVKERFRDWLEAKKISIHTTFTDLDADQKAEFDRYLKDYRLTRKGPRFRDHLGDYTRWLGFWLFNMVYTALNDFVRRTARAIAKAVSRKMQAISDKIWAPFAD